MPLIVHWPGAIKPGSTNSVPVITCDLYPTLLAMTGVADAPGHQPDGVNLVPLLKQTGVLERDALYWHYPHYQLYQQGGTTPYGAIRAGDFKLIEFFDGNRIELYNLAEDVGEAHDLALRRAEQATALRTRLHAWRKSVGAQLPTVNTAYDPTKPEHIPAVKKK